MTRRPFFTFFAGLLCLASIASVDASDHLDAPALDGMGDVDINDLYAFQSPDNAQNTVLIMTVNPFAAPDASFNSNANYTFQIDNTGDAVADLSYNATFSAGGMIDVQLNGASIGSGSVGTSISLGDVLVQAGRFDDPFFFDLAGFSNDLMFTGDDAFAGADVSAIVLEVPSSILGTNIGVWATTSDTSGQIDRVGRPAINTVLIPEDRKDEFNQAAPAGDFAAFNADVNAAIAGLSDQANADALTPILLPDVLTFDTSSTDGFLNGRQLEDDVIDDALTLLTASATPIGDGVNANDVAFPGTFPYLATANVPEPTGAFLALLALPLILRLRKRN